MAVTAALAHSSTDISQHWRTHPMPTAAFIMTRLWWLKAKRTWFLIFYAQKTSVYMNIPRLSMRAKGREVKSSIVFPVKLFKLHKTLVFCFASFISFCFFIRDIYQLWPIFVSHSCCDLDLLFVSFFCAELLVDAWHIKCISIGTATQSRHILYPCIINALYPLVCLGVLYDCVAESANLILHCLTTMKTVLSLQNSFLVSHVTCVSLSWWKE